MCLLCLFIAKYGVFLKLPQTYITIENPFDRTLFQPDVASADSAVRILSGLTVRRQSVKIKFKFEIRTVENLFSYLES